MTRQHQQASDKDQIRRKEAPTPETASSAEQSSPIQLSTAGILRLQQTIGNQAVMRLIDNARQQSTSARQRGKPDQAAARTVQRDPKSTKNPNITVTPITTPDQETDEELAQGIMDKQYAILEGWTTALQNFQVVMTSSSDAETRPDFQKVLVSFLEDKLLGEFTKRIPAGAHAGDVFALLGKLVDEAKRAGAAGLSAKLRDFFVSYNTQIGTLKQNLLSTKTEFVARVRMVKEDMLAGKGTDEYGMMRMNLVEMLEALDAQLQRSTPQALFKILSEKWLLSSKAGAVPAWVGIRVDADLSVRDAQIHGPGGQKIAEQLLKDSPGGVDVYNMPVPRQIAYYEDPDGFPVMIRLDANGRLVNDGTMLEGDRTLIKKIEGHGLKPTKNVTGD